MSPSLDELIKQGEGNQEAADLGDGIFNDHTPGVRDCSICNTVR